MIGFFELEENEVLKIKSQLVDKNSLKVVRKPTNKFEKASIFFTKTTLTLIPSRKTYVCVINV